MEIINDKITFTKRLTHENKEYVWISSGDIMARKIAAYPFIRIKNKAQVDSIERDKRLTASHTNNNNNDAAAIVLSATLIMIRIATVFTRMCWMVTVA